MDEHITSFVNFRKNLYDSFTKRADATMDLIDALSGNIQPASGVQVSLSPLFRREYASLHDAVDNFFVASSPEKEKQERNEHQQEIMKIVAPLCPEPSKRKFYLLALDATTQPRQFANTLEDRGFVYKPNPISGNKPVTIGHSYSALVALPEKEGNMASPWVIPLSSHRVPTDEKATDIGASQVRALMEVEKPPFGKKLSVLVGDTAYSAVTFLNQASEHKKHVTIVRVRGDRTFFRKPVENDTIRKGHPTWFGSAFRMNDSSTWGTADETAETTYTTYKGRVCHAEIQGWTNMLMTGKRDIPMHKHPFTLIRITVKDDDGKNVYKNPIWIIIFGERRHEISLIEAYDAYDQRFDIEHFFRFGKNRLLLDDYQTPVTEHEENWWEIVFIAYAML